jgi:SAM-dependent methyltransferase
MTAIKRAIGRRRRNLRARWYRTLDRLYLPLDRTFHKRAKNLALVPSLEHRIGGKRSYGEWCQVIGVFQALIAMNLLKPDGNRVVDIGCGTGLLAIASTPFVKNGGHYTGIDVGEAEIKFAQQHYPSDSITFVHSTDRNEAYISGLDSGWQRAQSVNRAPEAPGAGAPPPEAPRRPSTAVVDETERARDRSQWPVDDGTVDLVTALSVWTHFNEKDACHYTSEVSRVLKPGGRALITLFLVDDGFENLLREAPDRLGDLSFTVECCPSGNWLTPPWTRVPGDVVGLRPAGLETLLEKSGLLLRHYFPGSWKQSSGVYFQDVAVLEKPA